MKASGQLQAPAAVLSVNNLLYTLNRRLGWPWRQSECFREEKDLLTLLGFECPTVQPTATSLCSAALAPQITTHTFRTQDNGA